MAPHQDPKELSVFFTKPPSTEASYVMWPNSTNEPLRVQIDHRPVDLAESLTATNQHDESLSRCLQQISTSTETQLPRLTEHINNLYYWRYRPLFRNLRLLKLLFLRRSVSSLALPSARLPVRRFTTSRGDEGPSIWTRFENEVPYYLAFLKPWGHVAPPQRVSIVGFMLSLRPWLLFTIRLGLSLVGSYYQGVKKRLLPTTPGVHVLAVARSWSQAEYFVVLADHLKLRGITVGVFLDLNLFQALGRTPSWASNRPTNIFYSTSFSTATDYLRSTLSCIANALKVPKQINMRISDGSVEITEDFAPLIKELELTHVDHDLHLRRLNRAITTLSPHTLFSGESISPYIFSHGTIARAHGLKHIRFQQVGVSASDFVKVGQMDQLILNDESLMQELKGRFAQEDERFFFLGHQNFLKSRTRRVPTDGSLNSPFIISFFSQPLDGEASRSIVKAISEHYKAPLAEGKMILYVKVHPRDSTTYHDIHSVRIVDRQESASSLLRTTNFAVSRSSSVLLDALSMGVPFTAVRLSPIDIDLKAPYFDDRLQASVFSIAEFRKQLDHLDQYLEEFSRRRDSLAPTLFRQFDWTKLAELCGSAVRS